MNLSQVDDIAVSRTEADRAGGGLDARRPRLERVLAGQRNWWFLGAGGVAKLGDKHIDGGWLRPEAETKLRERGLFTVAPHRTYALTVLTSTDCNLGCGYCFQNIGQDLTGGTRPPRIAHARLNSATITSILEFTRRQMAEQDLEKLTILLFGGEPLLNPSGCLELLSRASEAGMISAGMISNLTLLTPALARKLSDRGLRSVQVTFDGDRDEHDQIRVRRSRGGTFDAIVTNMARATEVTPLKWQLRVNVSHHNYAGIDALVERLAAALDPSRCSIYFSRVGDVGVGYANDLLHTQEMTARFGRWQRRALDLGFSVPRPRAHLPCQTCGHGDGRYGAVINADGTLSSCWETAGKPGWDVGSITAGYLPSGQTRDRWIRCEDNYQFAEEANALAAFQDAVDASLLDYLSESGRL